MKHSKQTIPISNEHAQALLRSLSGLQPQSNFDATLRYIHGSILAFAPDEINLPTPNTEHNQTQEVFFTRLLSQDEAQLFKVIIYSETRVNEHKSFELTIERKVPPTFKGRFEEVFSLVWDTEIPRTEINLYSPGLNQSWSQSPGFTKAEQLVASHKIEQIISGSDSKLPTEANSLNTLRLALQQFQRILRQGLGITPA